MRDNLDFKDKVAIVTGSSMGIGKSIAIELGKRGASVVLNGRNTDRLHATEKELEQMGIQNLVVAGDVAVSAEATRVVEKTVKTFGRLDMLINNAGVSMRGLFENVHDEVVQKVVGSNLFGTINMTRAALPHIRTSRGNVVLISSLVGIHGMPWVSIYSASKMALTGLAESLRLELDGSGIHIGIVYVGITQNEQEKQVLDQTGSLIPLAWDGIRKGQTREKVARSVMRLIKRRKSKTVLTGLGHLQGILNRVSPHLVERLIRSAHKTVNHRFR